MSTFQSAIERIKEYPDFIFTAGSALHYKWVQETDSELFEQIKKYVQLGKWNIVNGWWVQPDCNIPSGESFVRHCLYGKNYFKEKFNIDVTVGYNVDSFGHNASLPQILSKAGFKYYIFFRPNKDEKNLPSTVFRWQSPDGSNILASRPPVTKKSFYCTEAGDLKEVINEIKENLNVKKLSSALFFYGVGNHGGGPTKKNIESIKEYNDKEVKIEFSSIEKFFNSISEESIPVVKDELQHHAVGCYTSHCEIKRLNRKAENSLYKAELFSALAYKFLKYKYPEPELTTAWQLVLFNQFHDILAGSAIPKAYVSARDSYGHVLHTTGVISNHVLRFIINCTNSYKKRFWLHNPCHLLTNEKEKGTITVFNSLSWKRDGYIKIHLFPYDWEIKNFVVYDSKWNILPSQIVTGQSIIRPEVLVYVKDIPACGYKTLFWEPKENENPPVSPFIKGGLKQIENDFWLLKIDPKTGYIKSLFDKTNKVEILKKPSNVPVIIDDRSDTWSHNVSAYPKETDKFKRTKIILQESGPARTTLKIISEYNKSKLEQDIGLYPDKIEFKTKINWNETFKMLKIKFDLNLDNVNVISSVPYGYIKRDNTGLEEPCQAWIDVWGKLRNKGGKLIDYGIGFINESKYAYDIKNNILRLSILRSPVYAWDFNVKLEKDKSYEFMDKGEHCFTYQIYPHKNKWEQTELVNKAYELNIPLDFINYPFKLSNVTDCSFVEINPKTVILTALKKAEKDNSLILRILETIGKDTDAEIKFTFLNKSIKFKINHNEIKTFKFDYFKDKIIFKEVNLLEE